MYYYKHNVTVFLSLHLLRLLLCPIWVIKPSRHCEALIMYSDTKLYVATGPVETCCDTLPQIWRCSTEKSTWFRLVWDSIFVPLCLGKAAWERRWFRRQVQPVARITSPPCITFHHTMGFLLYETHPDLNKISIYRVCLQNVFVWDRWAGLCMSYISIFSHLAEEYL